MAMQMPGAQSRGQRSGLNRGKNRQRTSPLLSRVVPAAMARYAPRWTQATTRGYPPMGTETRGSEAGTGRPATTGAL